MLEIKIKLSMAFYLQTDGQIERTNQELKQYLRMYINYSKKKEEACKSRRVCERNKEDT